MSRALRVLAIVLLLAAVPLPSRAESADEATVRQMNDDYVRAFLSCDVGRFRSLLADDFRAVLADGRVIDKAEFLRQAAERPDARDLRLHDVVIRPFGDSELVEGLVTYRRADGSQVRTRYSSLYARRAGAWAIAWAQWTRVTAP